MNATYNCQGFCSLLDIFTVKYVYRVYGYIQYTDGYHNPQSTTLLQNSPVSERGHDRSMMEWLHLCKARTQLPQVESNWM